MFAPATAGSAPGHDGVPATLHGPDVLAVFERACDWAAGEQHALVTIDHFLFVLAEQEIGAQALQAAGVSGVADYEIELLNVVHTMPAPALEKENAPIIESSVLAILNHALAFARRDGRDASSMSDVIAAVLDALQRSQQDTEGMAKLRKRWPRATQIDEKRELLLEIKDALAQQPTMIARALATELALLRDRVATLETQKIVRPTPWYRRLNVVMPLALCVLSAAAAAVWTVAG